MAKELKTDIVVKKKKELKPIEDKIVIGFEDGNDPFVINLKLEPESIGKMAGLLKKYDIENLLKGDDDVKNNAALIEFISLSVVNFEELFTFLFEVDDETALAVLNEVIKKSNAIVLKFKKR